MVQANELRIGNYVQIGVLKCQINSIHTVAVTDEMHYRVSGLIEADPQYYRFNDYDVDPILLTSEILHDAGFRKQRGEWHLGGFILAKYQDELVFKVLDQIVNYNPIKYVHQLQNIYHALCRKELYIEF